MNHSLRKKLTYQLSKPLPFRLMRQLTQQKIIFPFYHLVSDKPSPVVKHLYPVSTVDQFQSDLDFLLKFFVPASYEEVIHFSKNKKFKGKPSFFLTFDDGFSECFHIVLPLLKERNITAAFFINPAFVGNHLLSHRQKVSLIIEHVLNDTHPGLLKDAGEIAKMDFKHSWELIGFVLKLTIADLNLIDKIAAAYRIDFNAKLQHMKPYMDVSQLRSLTEEGFIIGSHSDDHPEFNLLSVNEMKQQVNRSFQFLEEKVGVKERFFSFPFHDIGVPLSFFHFLQNEAGVTTSFGTSGIKHDNAPGHIQRIPMEMHGFKGAQSILRSEYFYYLVKAVVHKNFVNRV